MTRQFKDTNKSISLFVKSIIFLLSALIISTPLYALTEAQLDMFAANDILFFDPDGNDSDNNCYSGSVSVSGSEIKEKIWNGLVSVGFTKEQTAGIMGNMAHESGFSPARHETLFYNRRVNGWEFDIWTRNEWPAQPSYGIGLIQWSFMRRARVLEAIKSHDPSLLPYIDDNWQEYGKLGGDAFFAAVPENVVDGLLTAEIQFLWDEINRNYKGLLGTTTVYDAAKYFLEDVEAPQNPHIESHPDRATDAQAFFDLYGGLSRAVQSNQQSVIYVGGARMVGLCSTMSLSNCITDTQADYNWLIGTAESQIKTILDANPTQSFTIVINLGRNDLGNAQKYAEEYQRLAASDWSTHKLVITALSISPMSGEALTTTAIESFNTIMAATTITSGSYCSATATIATIDANFVYTPEGHRQTYEAMTTECGISSTSPTGVTCFSGAASAYTDDNYTIFLQGGGQPWSGNEYSERNQRCYDEDGSIATIASSGCGPSSLAMIITALTGNTVTPDILAKQSTENDYRVCGSGSNHNIAFLASKYYGLKVTSINPNDEVAVNTALRSGAMILVAGKGSSPFSEGGHFIAVRGVTSTGKWKIFDSAGKGIENSSKEWEPSAIAGKGANPSYAISK